jgi:hypothetical protein
MQTVYLAILVLTFVALGAAAAWTAVKLTR